MFLIKSVVNLFASSSEADKIKEFEHLNEKIDSEIKKESNKIDLYSSVTEKKRR